MMTVLAPGAPWPYKPKEIKWAYGTGKRALSDDQVREVCKARADKVRYAVLEMRYKVGRKVLSDAVHGRGAYKWG